MITKMTITPALRGTLPTVADVMTQVVVTVTPETPLQEAIDLFTRRHISGAPVVSNAGELLGVVSTTDVLRAESSGPAQETAYYLEDELSGTLTAKRTSEATTVMDVATRRVVAIDENAPLAKAAHLLLKLGIRRLLVTRKGKLAGVLSATDVVKWVAQPVLEAESA
jgi:CBS domain-containing protein